MAGAYKTPGVYIVEKDAFPSSVVEVATAVPAFVGYTEKADNKGSSLAGKPWRITSLAEYHSFFGGAPVAAFELTKAAAGTVADLTVDSVGWNLDQASKVFRFYHSLVHFFQNGGGSCYIVSVGNYDDSTGVEKDTLSKGIETLLKEQEPTMLVIPDAVSLAFDECIALQQDMLAHCNHTHNRFAILDIPEGFKDRKDPSGDCIEKFRGALGTNFLDMASAYYPWVHTGVVPASSLTFANIANGADLKLLLLSDLTAKVSDPKKVAAITTSISTIPDDSKAAPLAADVAFDLHKTLLAVSSLYALVLGKLRDKLNLLPPSAAMAGIYTMVDNNRGVWKAPANVSLNNVTAPTVNLTNDEQEDLNVTTSGKSINAVRTFVGEGTLVWGARTLDGNSLDWRYVNVRRTMIMLEESVKLAAKAYVFEPNTANTWVTVKGMIGNFLNGIWKRGGLAGSTPEDAFGVFVGLGETMTAEDILEGILRVTVQVALVRPAEFIEITFQQQLQKS